MDPYKGKTPKAWLHEICIKMLGTPMFTTTEVTPKTTPPQFRCEVYIKFLDGSSTPSVDAVGKTKKVAEHEASKKMLIEGLHVTPARLAKLDETSRRALQGVHDDAPSTGRTSNANGEETDVSDTDDDELNLPTNHIGDLMALCASNFNIEPKFDVIGDEGPPHKKIFTVECSVVVESRKIDISTIGRRNKKQMAKKLAALRALRKVKALGYKYVQYEDTINTDQGKEDIPDKTSDLQNQLAKMGISDVDTDRLQSVLTASSGIRPYCNDLSHECLKLCTNYQHAFQHLKKSEILDDFLVGLSYVDWAEPNMNAKTLAKYGGAKSLLEKICTDLDIQLEWFNTAGIETDAGNLLFLQLKYPFKFNYFVPDKSVHYGDACDEVDGSAEAATCALEHFRLMFAN